MKPENIHISFTENGQHSPVVFRKKLPHPTSPRLLCGQLYRQKGSAAYCRANRVGNSLFRSKSLILKSDCDSSKLLTQKRVIRWKNLYFPLILTISPLCSLLKSDSWVIRSGRSWQKSDGSDLFFFNSKSLFWSQKQANPLKTDEKIRNPAGEQAGRGWVRQLFFRRQGSAVRSQ